MTGRRDAAPAARFDTVPTPLADVVAALQAVGDEAGAQAVLHSAAS